MNELSSPDEVFEDHFYRCAHCGQDNAIFVDTSSTWMFLPGGVQQQQLVEECQSCCGQNLVVIVLSRDGVLRLHAERAAQG